jgi:DNA polymerase III epsilon subunit-like protein
MAKYILFDTETTGNQEEDRIIQIGAMIISSKSDIEIYDELSKAPLDIKIEAMEVHNITPNMLINKPKTIDTTIYKKIEEFNKNENYLIAHNINFDLKMIQKEGFINQYKLIDTLRCSRHLYKELSYHRLQYLRYKLDIYKEEEKETLQYNIKIKAHDAIGDVLVMKLLLSKLVEKCKNIYPKINPMIKLEELTKTPILIEVFKFGKYKDRKIKEIAQQDIGYINWMKSSMKLDEDMKYTLEKITRE